jgi:hypothetical protein
MHQRDEGFPGRCTGERLQSLRLPLQELDVKINMLAHLLIPMDYFVHLLC